ncbi:hypothetical protein AAG906_010665 [Vitis piasezkii]
MATAWLLFEKLQLEDPWLPPKPWESISSESPSFQHQSSSSVSLYNTSTLSETSLVRLAMNALQGVNSALISIDKLSAAFCSHPADRTFHQIPSLWNRSLSTYALGNILRSIGCSGSVVFLLRKFVDYFLFKIVVKVKWRASSLQSCKSGVCCCCGEGSRRIHGALDTLYASISFRRLSKSVDMPFRMGSLTSVVHSELTLLEVYLHTKELRTQIQALGNVCNLPNIAPCSLESTFEDIISKASLEFCNFLEEEFAYLFVYTTTGQLSLKVADPVHHVLLKYLFLQSCEPYCGFIRSWIYKAEISDPYREFIIEYADDQPPFTHGKAGVSVDFSSARIREQDGVAVPCFLKDLLVPLFRAGQQLQVLKKLLEICNYVATDDHTYEDILPCWRVFNYGTCKEPFYERMQQKLENLSTKLETRYRQVVPAATASVFLDNNPGGLNIPLSFTLEDTLVSPCSAERRDSNGPVGTADSEACSTTDEFSSVMDALESSESASLNSSEEQNDFELPKSLVGLEQKYLSALCFVSPSISINNSLQKPPQSEKLYSTENKLHEICKSADSSEHFEYSHHNGAISSHIPVHFESEESNWSWMSEDQYAGNQHGSSWPLGGLLKNPFNDINKTNLPSSECGIKMSNRNVGVLKEEDISHFGKKIDTYNSLAVKANDKDQHENRTYASPNSFNSQSWNLKYHCNILSMNPMRHSSDHGESFPFFDFSYVEDPLKLCVEKLNVSSGHGFGAGAESPSFTDSDASAISDMRNYHDKKDYNGDDTSIDNTKSYICSSLDVNQCNQEDVVSANVSGGSSWETLLASSGNAVNNSVGQHTLSLGGVFEMPLEFIINKCLLPEILLQYKYVSKLTIKLLEEGFDLQEHFLALRRYHFMELADWADLFIMSLWNHRWNVTEADQRLSEIQGLLELSLQRSSCERDLKKDKLFVYMKGHAMAPLSTFSTGVHSFSFLGLGYRVDWPISIILTPGALKIYADIFSFLIQVKLAAFSLTDVWCSLKDLMHLVSQNRHSSLHGQKIQHLHILIKTRHQVNHFVSTLQQYVQSHLSHVSWCRFLQSLNHKVKDMMDLESVHMTYLMDSLHVCFLSDATRSVATVIESILQCAVDFRFCLTGCTWEVKQDQGDVFSKLSQINITQVLAIKEHLIKSERIVSMLSQIPKHGEFGLSRFWGYLNYNEYYSDANEIGKWW